MSKLEESVLSLIKLHKLPLPEREWRFLPDRRFRFDFAYPDAKIGVEVEGITKYGPAIGRHQSYDGFTRDCEKYTLAALNGWLVVRVTQEHVDNLKVLDWIRDALDLRGAAA